MESKKERLGDHIRRLRGKRSQTEIAHAVGVTKAAVSKWESGGTHDIQLETFFKLADELGVDPRELATGEKTPRESDIAPRHLDLLRLYIGLAPDARAAIRALIEALAGRGP